MHLYAFILADIAADTLSRAYGRDPESIQSVVDVVPPAGCACGGPGLPDMRSAIEFESAANDRELTGGLLFGGLANDRTLFALAKSHGLTEDQARPNADDLVAEFLNIVIGLAAAEWAVKGLEINFNPPVKASELSGKIPGKLFRIVLTDGPDECLALLLRFNLPADLSAS